MAVDLKWGSPEWRTHLRRSLAQRKRHGEKITDIEGLINYIEAKGPGKEIKIGKAKKGQNSATAKGVSVQKGQRKSSGSRSQKQTGNKSLGRQQARPQAGRPQQKGVTVLKVGQHDFI